MNGIKKALIAIVVLTTLGAMLAGAPATAEPPARNIATVIEHTPQDPKSMDYEAVTFAVAGDSITAWLNYSYPTWNGYNDPHSWAGYAVDDRTVMVGGYARSGVGVQGVAALIQPTCAEVLVIHLGTNNYDLAPADLVPYLDTIVATAASAHVVVVAIPPTITVPGFVQPVNAQLAIWAHSHDYTFVNPYRGLVTHDDVTWLPGFSDDGIHPTPYTASLTGPVIAAAIHQAAGR